MPCLTFSTSTTSFLLIKPVNYPYLYSYTYFITICAVTKATMLPRLYKQSSKYLFGAKVIQTSTLPIAFHTFLLQVLL